MCLDRHSSQDFRENMHKERIHSQNNHRMGGTDTDLLHILGSLGEGVLTGIIIFILSVLLLTLGSAGLFLYWRCVKDCNHGSYDKYTCRKMSKYEQRFSQARAGTSTHIGAHGGVRDPITEPTVGKGKDPGYASGPLLLGLVPHQESCHQAQESRHLRTRQLDTYRQDSTDRLAPFYHEVSLHRPTN